MAPESYRISGKGEGGLAGFASGGATVKLTENGAAETLMEYDVDAQVGGKIAMLGSRLIDSTARSLAEQFFTKFAALMKQAPAKPSAAKPKAAKKVKAKPAARNRRQKNLRRRRRQSQPRQKRRRPKPRSR